MVACFAVSCSCFTWIMFFFQKSWHAIICFNNHQEIRMSTGSDISIKFRHHHITTFPQPNCHIKSNTGGSSDEYLFACVVSESMAPLIHLGSFGCTKPMVPVVTPSEVIGFTASTKRTPTKCVFLNSSRSTQEAAISADNAAFKKTYFSALEIFEIGKPDDLWLLFSGTPRFVQPITSRWVRFLAGPGMPSSSPLCSSCSFSGIGCHGACSVWFVIAFPTGSWFRARSCA